MRNGQFDQTQKESSSKLREEDLAYVIGLLVESMEMNLLSIHKATSIVA